MSRRTLPALLLGLAFGAAAGAGLTAMLLVTGTEEAGPDVAEAAGPPGTTLVETTELRRLEDRVARLEDENRALRRDQRVRVEPRRPPDAEPPRATPVAPVAPGERTIGWNLPVPQETPVDVDRLAASVLDTSLSAEARLAALTLISGVDAALAARTGERLLASGEADSALRLQALAAIRAAAREGDIVSPAVRAAATNAAADSPHRLVALSSLVVASPDEGLPVLERLLASGAEADRTLAVNAAISASSTGGVGPLLAQHVNRDEYRPHVNQMVDVIARQKDKRWSAKQMVGPPDQPINADLATAWAAKKQQMGRLWIELTYETAVEPAELRIHETLNAGAVVEVAAQDGNQWVVLWTGTGASAETPRWFSPALVSAGFTTRKIRIIVDTDSVDGWNEIDAVELVAVGGLRQWVQNARAQSSYSD